MKHLSRLYLLVGMLMLAMVLVSSLAPRSAAAASEWYRRGRLCNSSSVWVQALIDWNNNGWQNLWIGPGSCVGGKDTLHDVEGVWGRACWATSSTTYQCDVRAYKVKGMETVTVSNSWFDSSNPMPALRQQHVRVSGGWENVDWRAHGWPRPDILNMKYILD